MIKLNKKFVSLFNKETATSVKTFFVKKRPFLNGSILEYLIIFIIFTALTIFYTNFIAFNITSQVFVGGPGDGTAGFLWYNFADHSLNPLLGLTDFVNYPYGEIMGGAAYITYIAIWMPLRVLSYIFGAVAGINLITFWGFISAGMGAYWLLKRLTKSVSVSIFAGFAAAFVPYNIYKSTAHLPFIFCIVFILILAAFVALWSRPTIKRGIIFGAAIALAFYTNGYFILLSIVMVFGMLIAGLFHSLITKAKWIDYWRRFKTLLISLACLFLLLIPVIFVNCTQGNQLNSSLSASRGDIAAEIEAYSSKLIDFILPPIGNPLLPIIDSNSAISQQKNSRSNSSESMMYVGFVLIALSAIGFTLIGIWIFNKKHSTLEKMEKSDRDKYLLVGLIVFITVPFFLAFMFSPSINLFGRAIVLPGQFLIDHNIALWRVMSRFFIPLHALVAVFAAYTAWVVLRYSRLINRSSKNRQLVFVLIIEAMILITAVEYWTTASRPSFDINDQPSAYIWLKQQSDIKVIAELPIVDPLDEHITNYVTAQLYHGKKIVNIKEATNRQVTNVIGSINNRELINFVHLRGAQAVLVHDVTSCAVVDWGVVTFDDSANNICVYRFNDSVSNDDVFVKFGKGFIYTLDKQVVTNGAVKIINNSLVFDFIDNSFKPSKAEKVHYTANLAALNRSGLNGTWTIKQLGITVATGSIINSTASIDTVLFGNSDVEMYLNIDNAVLEPSNLELENVISTAL